MQTRDRLEFIKQECQIRSELQKIQFAHYFSNNFMEKNTQYFCIEEFFEALGITSQAALERLPMEVWEQHVQKTTVFDSWQEMLNTAGQEFAMKYYH